MKNNTRKYFEAYDDRYRQVHALQYQWASPIVAALLQRHALPVNTPLLELGCGEGRDAAALLRLGYCVTATDISPEAIRYCREKYPAYSDHFQVLDCVNGEWEEKYPFLYAVAVVHMLVAEEDRSAFYRFIRQHLTQDGLALVCTMGDGTMERQSDISTAFDALPRVHGASGQTLHLAGTSCRMVSWDSFLREIAANGLTVTEHGLTAAEPDFPIMMYALMKKS